MADLTTQQEDVSKKFFEVFLNNNWDPSDQVYEELLSTCFGKSGIFSLEGLKPKVAADWRSSYDKQILALQQYMLPRNISTSGWVWSRGDGMMGFLNGIAKGRCGVSGSLDSWNPMDIVGVTSNKEAEIKAKIKRDVIKGVDKDINKDLLNGIMIEYIQKKALMPISLKKINAKERGAMELSKDLKGRNAKLKSKHVFKYGNFECDLEWSTYQNQWRRAQEISWDMNDPGSVIRMKYEVHVQARAFSGKNAREKPQHSLAGKGAGAMLGKSSIAVLESFLKQYKVSPVPSPNTHPKIPKPGKKWTNQQKQYWIALYNKLKTVTIDGNKINFGTPGAYGKGTGDKKIGFPAALDAACEADEKGLITTHTGNSDGRKSGSRLTAKLWGMEWLWRYYNMSKRKVWDSFAYQVYKASTKEAQGAGPFIKIFGQTGRSRKEIKEHIKTLQEDDEK